MRFEANGVDARVGSLAAGHVTQRVEHVHLFVVQCLGSPL
jgi:hypothetical protein